jgi:RNA polymerase sigma-70 factor (ECF subfamily)
MAVSDAELVARVRQGDVEAFGPLAQRYERTLLAAALARVGDIHTAEDVVQAALLRAFQRLSTLRDTSKFGPWLMQIARRQMVDVVRALADPVAVSVGDCRHAGVLGGSGGDAWSDAEDLLDAVARLPDHERVVVGLRYFDGHAVIDIAAITGRPVGTVTKQLSRAIKRLRCLCDKENQ